MGLFGCHGDSPASHAHAAPAWNGRAGPTVDSQHQPGDRLLPGGETRWGGRGSVERWLAAKQLINPFLSWMPKSTNEFDWPNCFSFAESTSIIVLVSNNKAIINEMAIENWHYWVLCNCYLITHDICCCYHDPLLVLLLKVATLPRVVCPGLATQPH